jgi:hypothetical protein
LLPLFPSITDGQAPDYAIIEHLAFGVGASLIASLIVPELLPFRQRARPVEALKKLVRVAAQVIPVVFEAVVILDWTLMTGRPN